MSRSVKIPKSRSPSMTSAEPVCRANIALAASITVASGPTATRSVLMTSLTDVTPASFLPDGRSVPIRTGGREPRPAMEKE